MYKHPYCVHFIELFLDLTGGGGGGGVGEWEVNHTEEALKAEECQELSADVHCT